MHGQKDCGDKESRAPAEARQVQSQCEESRIIQKGIAHDKVKHTPQQVTQGGGLSDSWRGTEGALKTLAAYAVDEMGNHVDEEGPREEIKYIYHLYTPVKLTATSF
jgi:hypothetical protein